MYVLFRILWILNVKREKVWNATCKLLTAGTNINVYMHKLNVKKRTEKERHTQQCKKRKEQKSHTEASHRREAEIHGQSWAVEEWPVVFLEPSVNHQHCRSYRQLCCHDFLFNSAIARGTTGPSYKPPDVLSRHKARNTNYWPKLQIYRAIILG